MTARQTLTSWIGLVLLGSVLASSGCQSASPGSLMTNPFQSQVPQQWEPEIVEAPSRADDVP